MCLFKSASLKKIGNQMFSAVKNMHFFAGSTITAARASDNTYACVRTKALGENVAALLGKRGALDVRYYLEKKDSVLILVFDYPEGSTKAKILDSTFDGFDDNEVKSFANQCINDLELCHITDEDLYELRFTVNKVKKGEALMTTHFLINEATAFLTSFEKALNG